MVKKQPATAALRGFLAVFGKFRGLIFFSSYFLILIQLIVDQLRRLLSCFNIVNVHSCNCWIIVRQRSNKMHLYLGSDSLLGTVCAHIIYKLIHYVHMTQGSEIWTFSSFMKNTTCCSALIIILITTRFTVLVFLRDLGFYFHFHSFVDTWSFIALLLFHFLLLRDS